MRRPPTGAPCKLIMQTNCAALIFIRLRKRPRAKRARAFVGRFRTKVGARSMSRWGRKARVPPERGPRGGKRGERRRKLVKFCNSIAVQTAAALLPAARAGGERFVDFCRLTRGCLNPKTLI